jgi:hypothetical protein
MWYEAMLEEMKEKSKTWDLVSLPAGKIQLLADGFIP